MQKDDGGNESPEVNLADYDLPEENRLNGKYGGSENDRIRSPD